METNYQKILSFMFKSGERLLARAGKIADIGITKKDLTDEDFAIESGFKEIITQFGSDHILYAEEENTVYKHSDNVWVVDPISSTASFIAGLPHYAIVAAHLIRGRVAFAAVYDPSVNEMFTAYKDKGAFLNGELIKLSNEQAKIVFLESAVWKEPEIISRTKEAIKDYSLERNRFSFAVNYCWVACGRFDGVVSFTKDSFPEFAGGFIIQEAGGQFTNINGESNINSTDRIFVGGGKKIYKDIFEKVKNPRQAWL